MSKLKENECICGKCKHYNGDEGYCMASGEHERYEEDTCEYWEDEPTEEELEAQKTDAAEKITHAKEVEGGEINELY